MRTHYAVWSVSAVGVYGSVAVCAHHTLVSPRPDKASGKERIAPPSLPVFLKRGSAALVILAVQKFCGHKHIVTIAQTRHTSLVGRVVVSIHTVKHCPGVYHMALLRIILAKQRVESEVEAALVAVAPGEYAGVVGVGGQHLLEYLRACCGAVVVLPARQLIEVEHAERVAEVEQGCIGRIVGTYCVGVHSLYELHVLQVAAATRGASRLGIEAVAVDAFYP